MHRRNHMSKIKIESIERQYWIVEMRIVPGWGVVIECGRPAIYVDKEDAKAMWRSLIPGGDVRYRLIALVNPPQPRWKRMLKFCIGWE